MRYARLETRLIAALPLACLVFSSVLALRTHASRSDLSPQGEESFTMEHGPLERHCGIWSIYIVMRELGFAPVQSDILEQIQPGIYGNSMEQITEFLQNVPDLQVDSVKCSADDLYETMLSDTHWMAIVNLSDHWVVVHSVRDNALDIVDFPRRYFMPVDVIDMHWDGYVVLVRKKASLLSGRRMAAMAVALTVVVGLLCRTFHVRKMRRERCA